MKQQPTVLLCGDSPVCTSGFGRVMRHLAQAMVLGGWDVCIAGCHDQGDPHGLPGVRVWAAPDESLMPQRITQAAAACDPDLIILFTDIAICGQWALALSMAAGGEIPVPVLTYAPVDGGGLVPELVEWMARPWFPKGHTLATYTEWGKQEITQALGAGGYDLPDGGVHVIPHGIDPACFYPVDRDEAREQLGIREALDGDWLVLNANSNMPRKRIDATIAGFAEFLYIASGGGKPCPPARLWLHMETKGSWDVRALFRRECRIRGVEGDPERHLFVTSENLQHFRGVPDPMMNLIYNASDCGISTSGGEGWGLTSWEHAACRRPQVVVDFAAHREIFQGAALKVQPTTFQTAPEHLQVHAVVDPNDVGRVLEFAYGNRELIEATAQRGYEAATAVTWEEVGDRFADLAFSALCGHEVTIVGEGVAQ